MLHPVFNPEELPVNQWDVAINNIHNGYKHLQSALLKILTKKQEGATTMSSQENYQEWIEYYGGEEGLKRMMYDSPEGLKSFEWWSLNEEQKKIILDNELDNYFN